MSEQPACDPSPTAGQDPDVERDEEARGGDGGRSEDAGRTGAKPGDGTGPLPDVPPAAGGTDASPPAQGEGEDDSW
jgi:hypothetical protein